LHRVRGGARDHPGRTGRRHLGRRLVQLQAQLRAALRYRRRLGLGLRAGVDRGRARDRLRQSDLPPDRVADMRPRPVTRLALHIANLAVIAFFLLPLIAATLGALQSEKSLQAATRALLPPEWTLDNFRVILSGGAQKGAIFEQATYLPDNVKKIHYALTNSVLIATTVTLLTLTFGSLSAYTVARLRLRWVVWLMNLNVVARFLPVIVVIIPLYVPFRQLGLLNSVWGVIIALTGFLLPYGVVILAPYFATVPRELEEAARIDGCSRFGAFLRVTLPLST